MIPHALMLELEGDRLPHMVVLFSEFFELVQDGDVQVLQKGGRLRELALLNFVERIAKDPRLFLNIEQGQSRV